QSSPEHIPVKIQNRRKRIGGFRLFPGGYFPGRRKQRLNGEIDGLRAQFGIIDRPPPGFEFNKKIVLFFCDSGKIYGTEKLDI
ncbi:MAG: hypothetical protein PHC33_04190, partial [Candidatus Omnitrophica bacterium]|nr:hypothetical protein [Candidatus Omnitrophota bacterium]